MCTRTGECYRVDSETNLLTDEELAKYWKEVEADRKEVESFVVERIFQLCHVKSATQRPMDALWVRKRKRGPNG